MATMGKAWSTQRLSAGYPVVATICEGKRTILGTDHPIDTIVTREGPREWRVTFCICNGIADSSRLYRTKRDALRAAGVNE